MACLSIAQCVGLLIACAVSGAFGAIAGVVGLALWIVNREPDQ